MLIKRALVTIVLLPIGIAAIVWGGWIYLALIAAFLGLAAWEYVNLWRAGGFQPAGVLVVGGVLALVVTRQVWGFDGAAAWLSAAVLLSMVYHLVQYERGREQAASDLAITLMGILYLGWVGAYMVSLRLLADGQWWVLLVLPAVWLSDTGAYLIGSRFGRHPLTPRLSPKKTWHGYRGGVAFGVLGGLGLAALYRALGAPAGINLLSGALIGLAMGIFPTLGDLGESMIKRQVGVKDSGKLLPGHGGAFDRIDSWLWAAVIGYYLILWLWV